ncbi:MAG: hypothetical protein U5R48_02395 [Gammaproteobacteria bacterium]|nr:hypothetical protein [Gammaproteobacteria bacterium]
MVTLIVVGCVSAANFLLEYGDYALFFGLFVLKGFCFGGLQFLPCPCSRTWWTWTPCARAISGRGPTSRSPA